MEHFIVSARKYRPQTFKDVVGQKAITDILVNAIEQNHLAQTLLFTGTRGVGKTTCVTILARKANQIDFADPNDDFTFNVFELDAASNNSVDDIRSLTDQGHIPPQTIVEIAARKKILTDEHSGRILVDAVLAMEEKEKMESLFKSI
jgi:DNA polymerase-3 subunit gamma/tau